ncbi:FecR family protein [Chitinophaga nivalis]|uniref:FecR domain-containing protein n=1 Tax=Chitinophaga nivalis TaxID=2991709 RepID=A0ABT3IRC2_9BACT|nr:FecR family protein [Chitinophaga nivalis]MCW3463796.1 FecR domain-containing protein [Chitinophaga nivalis]MCW3486514.1 FecR domain-containing protein [Chitinophaga nivalis]
MLNYRYIHFLLQKQQEQKLTAEEAQILEQWYQSLETMPVNIPEAKEKEIYKQQSWEQLAALYAETLPAKPAFRWRRLTWMAAAAILLLFIGIKRSFFSPKVSPPATWVSLDCPAGKRLKLAMPDGSVVWLNSASSLEYHPDYPAKREFKVRNGEVFFEAAKDAAHPFIVTTPHLAIRVLGTSFNVSAYTQLKQEKVTVAAGSVQVQDQQQCQVTLHQDEQIIYNTATALYATGGVNAGQANSWRNGDIYLTNVSLEELAVKLENIYGYDITFSSEQLKRCINSLHFNDKEPITKVLDLLKLIDKITYTIKDRKITIAGRPC